MKVRFSLVVKCVVLSVVSTIGLQAMTSPSAKNEFYWNLIVESIKNNDTKGAQNALRTGLKKGFDVNYIRSGWATLLGVANTVDLIKELVAAGANPNIKADNGYTPLHVMVIARYLNSQVIIKELVRAGADINAQDNLSNTPLMIAVLADNLLAIQTLLTTPGIDLMTKNKNGMTAFDIAKKLHICEPAGRERTQEIIKILTPYYTTLRDLGLNYIKKHRDTFTEEYIKQLPVDLQEALQVQQQQ